MVEETGMATNPPVLIADPERNKWRLNADPSPGHEMQNKEDDADDQNDME
jgi:hypothetical protein